MPHRSVPAAMPLDGRAEDDQPASWQARKSASTPLQIIEATLRCFREQLSHPLHAVFIGLHVASRNLEQRAAERAQAPPVRATASRRWRGARN